ncbi:hypothetical protein [Longimicrobium sp.]|uniref:hypothetical protein n=1 Tax=Longimicrobium sp. TaxID=2029185 RepID=UPI003B3B95B7
MSSLDPVPYAEAPRAIRAALEPLRGLRLRTVTRAAEMLTLGFGELEMVGKRQVAQYALNLQAPWRLDHLATGTVTGRSDVWEPLELPAPDGWHWDEGPNLRDHLLGQLFPLNEAKRRFENQSDDFIVREIEATAAGDLTIRFAGPYEFRVLPQSTRQEAWRLLRPGDFSPHFVFEAGRAGYEQ